MFIEMARDEVHGGAGWGFLQCVWAPAEKERGGGTWPFWSKILEIRAGDAVFHLRGVGKTASFVGYSLAATDGYLTNDRPPQPGVWGYSKSFLRADLKDFIAFQAPPRLVTIFASRKQILEEYFDKNRQLRNVKKKLFFVRQGGRLQCLNGAYLSEVDIELFEALFGSEEVQRSAYVPDKSVVNTGEQLRLVKARIGQLQFSEDIKRLYGHRCCFPSCPITEERFLVGSHIARWSDNDRLRGYLSNGLCFCLMHDKAFEMGLFTLNDEFRVIVSAALADRHSPFIVALKSSQGQQIRLATVLPSTEALAEHRSRVSFLRPSSDAGASLRGISICEKEQRRLS